MTHNPDIAHSLTVAVAGNPNCGKTTVFNGLTGGRQQIGNWPGVTVEKKEGRFRAGPVTALLAEPFSGLEEARTTVHRRNVVEEHVEFRVVDLPGIYSLSATSEDEKVARDFLTSGEPDLIVDVVDASNIERNLYLTTQLAEVGIPMVVVLTMIDVAETKHISIDTHDLSEHLGVPVIAINALHRSEIERLRTMIAKTMTAGGGASSPAVPHYPEALEKAINGLADQIGGPHGRWQSIRLLEGDVEVAGVQMNTKETDAIRESLQHAMGEELDVLFADIRYRLIGEITHRAVRRGTLRQTITERIDRLVIHRVFGLPIFLAAMFVVFWFTISVGGAFIDFFDMVAGGIFVDGVGSLLRSAGTPAWLVAVLADGVGGGLQTVASFIPVIFSMFFALAVLEDSGYMARAAFVMDRLMRWIGLPGKSFVPMLLGFGCTIPAVMATKTLESRKDRLMTIFMTPLMSCGARLPVYALVATAVFGRTAGVVVFSIYVIGIVVAVGTGLVMKTTIFRGEISHFVLELPPYHAPRVGQILRSSLRRLWAFVRRAGLTIVIMVGLLGVINSISFSEEGVSLGGAPDRSLLSVAGKAVTPVFGPMGITRENWPATVAIFTGLIAKEAAVGTLNSLYFQESATQALANRTPTDLEPLPVAPQDSTPGLGQTIGDALRTIPDGLAAAFGAGGGALDVQTTTRSAVLMRDRFSPASAFAYLLFILVYFPCVSALSVVIKEIGAGYGSLLAAYLTILAWALATIVYQLSGGGQVGWAFVGVAIIGAEVVVLWLLGRRLNGT